ncbi:MAG TPA: sensor histidine kinase [Caulobacteraceae bacterium]
MLTAFFQEASLRRLQNVNQNSLDEVVTVTNVIDGEVKTPQIQDARSLRVFSGKYWMVTELDSAGRLVSLARSDSLFNTDIVGPPVDAATLRQRSGEVIVYAATGPRGEPLLASAAVRQVPRRTQPLVFITAIDRTAVNQDVRRFSILTWVALGLLGSGLLVAVFVQVRYGLRPLYDLGREISDVRKGKSLRFTGRYPQEIAPLADELNALLDHNQEVVERQRTHVGNLAHALKTPLAVMLAEADAGGDGLADIVRRQTDIMRGQVDHHLRRARAAARSQAAGERTPVEEVLDELTPMLERVFQSKGVEIDWRCPDDLCFRGERQDLQEIVGNVLENACKWCRRKVRVAAGPDGLGKLLIVIEDDGPGLPPDQREAMLKRGERLDENAPGSGLGLSIVDELVRAYGGRMTLGESELGGLKAVIELPAVDT